MKRLHVHVSVENLSTSIQFYSTMFGDETTVTKPDYAKWLLDDSRVNFAISIGNHERPGIQHLGVQVERADELGEVYGSIHADDRPVREAGRPTSWRDKRTAERRGGKRGA